MYFTCKTTIIVLDISKYEKTKLYTLVYTFTKKLQNYNTNWSFKFNIELIGHFWICFHEMKWDQMTWSSTNYAMTNYINSYV